MVGVAVPYDVGNSSPLNDVGAVVTDVSSSDINDEVGKRVD
jgi:hypothetical protein